MDDPVFQFLGFSFITLFALSLFAENVRISNIAYEWMFLSGVFFFSFVAVGGSDVEGWFGKVMGIVFVYLFGFFRGKLK